MSKEDHTAALETALLGVPHANLRGTSPMNSPRASPRASPRTRRVAHSLQEQEAGGGAPTRRRSVSECEMEVRSGGLVSCLKDAGSTARSGLPRRSKSVRVRFVRSPLDAARGTLALNEGAVLIGRSPPRVSAADFPPHPHSTVSRPSPRVNVTHLTQRQYRRVDDVRHGSCPPETNCPPAPPPSPPSLTSGTSSLAASTGATPRGVAPRTSTAPHQRALARVAIRGDLDTTVIGEVHRQNLLRYSGELSSNDNNTQAQPSLTDALSANSGRKVSKVSIVSPIQQQHQSQTHSQNAPTSQVESGDKPKPAEEAPQSVVGGWYSRTRNFGDRENIKVTYTTCKQDVSPPVAVVPSSRASTDNRIVPSPSGGGLQPPDLHIGGRPLQATNTTNRVAARLVIRRRRTSINDKPDSDSDSVDRIDVENRPQVGVRRSMSLRAPARQVWTPGDGATAVAVSGTTKIATRGQQAPVVTVRRSVSLRILPRRSQQPNAALPTGDENTTVIISKTEQAAKVEKPSVAEVRRDSNRGARESAAKEETKESVPPTPVAPPRVDLLSSCIGGLGTNQTKWLAEQNRKRALKSLEPVTTFTNAPTSQPLTLCFEYAGSGLSHKTVLESVNKTIHRYRDTKVVRVQYVPRSVILTSMWMDNRWVVSVNNENAERALLAGGVSIFGKEAKCRRYDDVLAEEYKRFLDKEERSAE